MAGFVTGYLQREVYLDIDVVNDCKRGDFVVVTNTTYNADGTVAKRGSMVKATKAQVTAKTATHVVAQSDQTLGYGHVPVEDRDYRYDPTVKGTVTTAPTADTTTWKHVALFKITNWDDVVPALDGSDRI